MQKLIISIFLLILFCSPAFAQNYFGLTIGAVLPKDLDSENKSTATKLKDVNLSSGEMWGVKIGHILKSGILAVELEGFVIKNTDVNNEFYYYYPTSPNPPVNINADISMETLMFNIFVRTPNKKISPYAGLGMGCAWFHVYNIHTLLPPGYFWDATGSRYYSYGDANDIAFMYQFLGGISIELTKNILLNVDARFLQAKFDIKKETDFNIEATYKTYMVTTGLNFLF